MSEREKEELNLTERQYQDGTDPQILDIIDVPLLRACPKDHQVENWLIDSGRWWVKRGRLPWETLNALADEPEILWQNGEHSAEGCNDRVRKSEANKLRSSIFLIHPERIELTVCEQNVSRYGSQPRIRAEFEFNDCSYLLWVTDPVVESEYQQCQKGSAFFLEDCYLTVSLGEPFGGYCYKLVAAIIFRENDVMDIPF